MYFATNSSIFIPLWHNSCISHLLLHVPLRNDMVCILVYCVLSLQKGTMFCLCRCESFNVQKNWQLCSFLPKPSELVRHSTRLVGSTSNAKVKESNRSVGIMEEAFVEMKTDGDYMPNELVSIVSFNFCSIYFLFSIRVVIKFVITQAQLSSY